MKKIVSFLGNFRPEAADAFLSSMRDFGYTEAPYDREECLVMVVWGEHSETLLERLWRATEGLPTVVMDLGFFGREDKRGSVLGNFQICMEGLCKFPKESLPSDRFDALGLDVEDDVFLSGNTSWMIAGQVPNDTQHNLDEDTLDRFYTEAVRVGSLYKADSMYFRQHPKADVCEFKEVRSTVPTERGSEVPLSESLDRCAGVITYNSTLFYEATMRGIPVICHPSASYAHMATKIREPLRLRSAEEKLPFLHRVAYAQWTMDEIRQGKSIAFLNRYL